LEKRMPKPKTRDTQSDQAAPLSPVQEEAAEELSNEADANPETRSREERVRDAAYRRYESRGGAPGGEVQDWIDAEEEVDRSDRPSGH
jgi:Protein of unknown function (DUF2934)